MSEFFASIPGIGELFYYHTYLFYDEPLIFSCVTKTREHYFVAAIPPAEESNASWIAAPISSGKLLKLEKNLIQIRDAYTCPESLLWRINMCDDAFYAEEIAPSSLTDDLLPDSGEFLDFSGANELPTPVDAPLTQSQSEMRDVIELSLERDDQHISEIPCGQLGDVLNNVQQLFYAIAYKDGGLSGPIPRKIKESCTLCVSGMFAASVGIRLKSNDLSDMFGETPLTSTLCEFNTLFGIFGDQDALREFLLTQNPRVAVKYRALLRTLISNNTGIRINNASPNSKAFSRHYSTKQLAENLKLINSEIEKIVENKTYYGTLVGINVERNTFEFISTDNESIKGVLSTSISRDVFSVPQTVEAKIEITVGTDSMTKEERLLYTLLDIEPLVPNAE